MYGSVTMADVESWIETFFHVMEHQFVFIGYHFNLLDCMYAGCTMCLIGLVLRKIFLRYVDGRR